MLDLLVPILTIVALLAFAAVIIKAGKVPKMPAFCEKIVRCGIFNKLMFQNYNFRNAVHDGKMLPEMKIEKICGLYGGVSKEAE